MEEYLHQLVEVSRRYGSNTDYVIAGGGNTSYKNDDNIWVKASGSAMSEIDESGFVCLDRSKMRIIAGKQYSKNINIREQEVKKDLSRAIIEPVRLRPSVESSLHEIIQYKFVVHTHPTLVNSLLCASKSKELVSKLFENKALYLEYTDPGYTLFKAVYWALSRFRKEFEKEPKIIFLENHGVFVAADSIEEIDSIYDHINKTLKEVIRLNIPGHQENPPYIPGKATSDFLKKNKSGSFYFTTDNDAITQYYITDMAHFNQLSQPFTPDSIVYCKSNYLFVEDESNIPEHFVAFFNEHGYPPKIVGVKGKGLLAIEDSIKLAGIVMDVFKDMMNICYLAGNFGEPRPLNLKQIAFIDNWEVENYRRKVSKQT